jgi:hypothetical protein
VVRAWRRVVSPEVWAVLAGAILSYFLGVTIVSGFWSIDHVRCDEALRHAGVSVLYSLNSSKGSTNLQALGGFAATALWEGFVIAWWWKLADMKKAGQISDKEDMQLVAIPVFATIGLIFPWADANAALNYVHACAALLGGY